MPKLDWTRRQFMETSAAGLADASWLSAAGALSLTPAAQGAATEAPRGTAARFEAPYTLEVETPHVNWARPLPGGPIRLLAVPSVREGRALVELAQRLSLDLTTVSIDAAWDVNKWTMAFGSDYGARADKGDLSLLYSNLEAELTSDKKFDAILIALNHGWEALTAASREALARRVREGCGLVLIRPFAGELSPLTPLTPPPSAEEEYEFPLQEGATETSVWRRTSNHYITRGIPIESFPFHYLENYVYRAAPGATVLVESESGSPLLAVASHGMGRVAAFAYRNAGLSWHMPMDARRDLVDVYWEYFYALLCRALIYAARREPSEAADWDGPAVKWRLKNLRGEVEASGLGPRPPFSTLAPGRHFLELQSPSDWRISVVEIPQPDKIEDLRAAPEVITEGDEVEVTWRSSQPARIELLDGLGRVIARGGGVEHVRLRAGRPLTHWGRLRAAAGSAVEQTLVRFAVSREWNDFQVVLPWSTPPSYQPWIPAVDEQYRRLGITVLSRPERNFKLMVSAEFSALGGYRSGRENYLKRKAAYLKTGDKKFLTRTVTLQGPGFESDLRAHLEERARPLAPLTPLAYYVADEISLTDHRDPFDVGWAPRALAGFRSWLRREYSSLEILNQSWGTAFADWSDVLPMTTAEAQEHGNFAPWADHRLYMEQEFVRSIALLRRMLREIDPDARVSISGTQSPTPHNGCNWYAIDKHVDYLQLYSGGNQDAMHYLFRPEMLITGFTSGRSTGGSAAHYQQWQRLFHGHAGASMFWHYTLMNPDLTLTQQGKSLAEVFGRLQSGIARVFMNSTVAEDGVAIHFSMASLRGAWITDGKITAEITSAEETSRNFADLLARRDGWVKELERRGVQFRFLATAQIEEGALENVRVLILPYSIAVSDREAAEIERFLERGGVVYADEQTGRMDERCRWRKAPLWAGGREGLVRRGPGEVGVQPALDIEGDFLV